MIFFKPIRDIPGHPLMNGTEKGCGVSVVAMYNAVVLFFITIPDIPGHPLVSGTAKGMRSQRVCDV